MKVVRKEFHVCESIKLLETKPLEFRVFTFLPISFAFCLPKVSKHLGRLANCLSNVDLN